MFDRREWITAAMASATLSGSLAQAGTRAAAGDQTGQKGFRFPKGFIWGAATAGHQIEGNNINSDTWLMENVKPTTFKEPSLDAANSFLLWRADLQAARDLGLNTYRFSLEWARIEPEEGRFSLAMLNHYKQIIDTCRAMGLRPMVTFQHFTAPRWFAQAGGWTNPRAPDLFARYCGRAAAHLGSGIAFAVTMNEPNISNLLAVVLPPPVFELQRAMLQAAAKASGSERFSTVNAMNPEDLPLATTLMIEGHQKGRAAIKAVRPDLPVGVSLAMFDDQAIPGGESQRDRMRQTIYGRWLASVKGDDFLGVQNYERKVWSDAGAVPAQANADRNFMGSEVYAPSLAGAVQYAHAASGIPIMVTEHGVGTDDDALRARFIPAALAGLAQVMTQGVPVLGYVHWSLIDNFEWIFGHSVHFGLHRVDPVTFARTPKPSALVYKRIIARNGL